MGIKEFVFLKLIWHVFNVTVKLVSFYVSIFFGVEYLYFRQSTVPGSIYKLYQGEKLL